MQNSNQPGLGVAIILVSAQFSGRIHNHDHV